MVGVGRQKDGEKEVMELFQKTTETRVSRRDRFLTYTIGIYDSQNVNIN